MIEKAFDDLQIMFAEQAARAERMVEDAIRVLVEKDKKLAEKVIAEEEPLCNRLEKEIEAKAIEIIALHEPKAGEMRKIVSIIKANKDLERIGDQAVNIAEYTLYLIPRRQVKPLIDIPRMAKIAQGMIAKSIDAFLQKRVEDAQEVLRTDDLVDDLEEQIMRELITYMASDPATIERSLKLLFISRNIERIGDLAMNIAEEVIYYITGNDVKHPGLTEEGS